MGGITGGVPRTPHLTAAGVVTCFEPRRYISRTRRTVAAF